MSEADKAYKAAQELIARTRIGAPRLGFDKSEFRHLTNIPPEIQNFSQLNHLDLSKTQISDLSPISGMSQIKLLYLGETNVTDLTFISELIQLETLAIWRTKVSDLSPISTLTRINTLGMNGTAVTDLSPLLRLRRLIEEPGDKGLTFDKSAAALMDPKIAKIVEVVDVAERAKALFDYLELSLPSLPSEASSARGYTYSGKGPVSSNTPPPATDDPDQAELLNDLQRKAAQLSESLGRSNELAQLVSTVDHYANHINRSMSDLKLQLLYSAANTLRVAYEAH